MIFILFLLLQIVFSEYINVQPLSVPRYYTCSIVLPFHGLAFIAGGITNSPTTTITTDAIDIYNITSNSWSTAKLSVSRYFVSATALEKEGIAFFAGGTLKTFSSTGVSSFSNTNVVDVYDANRNQWSIIYLSQARELIASTTIQNNGIVIFGVGYTRIGSKSSNVIDIYNYKNNSFTTFFSGIARSYVKSESIGDIALIGGREEGKCDIYNATSGNWTIAIMPNFCRRNYASTSLPNEGLIFLAGGYDCASSTSRRNIIDIYNIYTKKWSVKYMQESRYNSAGVSIPNLGMIFFVGGHDSVGVQNTGEVINIKSNRQIIFSIDTIQVGPTCFSFPENEIIMCTGGMDGNGRSSSNVILIGAQEGKITTINPKGYENCRGGKTCLYLQKEIDCPNKNFCPEGSSWPNQCPLGTYGSLPLSSKIEDCLKCPIGTYSSYFSDTKCSNCYAGTYCLDGTVFPLQCPPNSYCPDGKEKIFCPLGTYYDGISGISINDCKSCEKGFLCEGQGKSRRPCGPGTYTNNLGSSTCDSCPEGYYCPLGTIEPKMCPINTYAVKGSSACTPCQSEQYTNGPGSAQCESCAGDQFQINGWWCMGLLNKILFVSVWIGSFLSGFATIRKLHMIVKERRDKILKANLRFTLFNFIHINKILKIKEQFAKSKNLSINYPSKPKDIYLDNC